MKNWFRRKILDFLHPQDECLVSTDSDRSRISMNPDVDIREHNSIEFTVTSANGGRVISTRRWDRKKETWLYKLHIITENEDFGEEIKNIVFMEDLSR